MSTALFSPHDPAKDHAELAAAFPGCLILDANAPLTPALERSLENCDKCVVWHPANADAAKAANALCESLKHAGMLDVRTVCPAGFKQMPTMRLIDLVRQVTHADLRDQLALATQWAGRAIRPRREAPKTSDGQDSIKTMAEMGLVLNKQGDVWNNAANVERALSQLQEFSSEAIWFDTFRARVMTTWKCDGICPREWQDEDDAVLLGWMQSRLGWHNLTDKSLRQGFMIFLQSRARHPLREYLDGLEWDQVERLPTFLADVYGAPNDEYHQAVGRCWLTSMVARAYDPGCKVDTMPVVEGGQGIRKSTSLEILGGEFYVALPRDFGSVDFVQCMDGAWLAEIPDMSGFRGRDLEQVKAFITMRHDRIRRSYARRAGTTPRQTVFAATANPNDWNDDDTGARRFWPIVATTVNTEYLTETRDQLFAEAIVRYRRGESWWDVPRETAEAHQEDRRILDPWQDIVLGWAMARPELTTKEVFEFALQMTPRDINKLGERRVGSILRRAGFRRNTKRDGERVFRVWQRADRLQQLPLVAIDSEKGIDF